MMLLRRLLTVSAGILLAVTAGALASAAQVATYALTLDVDQVSGEVEIRVPSARHRAEVDLVG